MKLARGSRALLQGRGPELATRETEGEMLARVMPELMTMKGILVLNDEAHHCYREKAGQDEEGKLTGDDRREAKRNREAARVWISGLEAAERRLGLKRVIDLSATPFFLRGSGYAEGTLFPWTVSDFSLMDAIECGIVKLPRVPVVDNVPGAEMPMYRNLWEHIGKKMPKKGRGSGATPHPMSLPAELQTALEALYGHYDKTFRLWEEAGIGVPPCFIVVCNNTATSKLLYDYIAGFHRESENGVGTFHNGRLPLFRNFDAAGAPLPRRRTLLIDSQQLESGDALDRSFRAAAADEIDRFRREIVERTRDRERAEKLTDQDLLREVMNTVGKAGRLGGDIRCVVSVAMLTEGWDASNVTHVLGLRAFGTQLLCEQVIGRSLRRQSYELNDGGLFDAEYADVFGVPFDFTAKPVVAPPQPPAETVQVKALSPERDDAEIGFPRVAGYRVELPNDRLSASFTEDSVLELTPEFVGPTITHNQGIIGEGHRSHPRKAGERSPVHGPLRTHQAAALQALARRERGAETAPVRPVETHNQQVAQGLPHVQGGDLSRAIDDGRTRRPRLREDRVCRHPRGVTSPAGQGAARSLQSGRHDPQRQLHHVPHPTLRDRTSLPPELGNPRQHMGRRVLPHSRFAPPGSCLGEEPQPRLRGAVPVRRSHPPLCARLHRDSRLWPR